MLSLCVCVCASPYNVVIVVLFTLLGLLTAQMRLLAFSSPANTANLRPLCASSDIFARKIFIGRLSCFGALHDGCVQSNKPLIIINASKLLAHCRVNGFYVSWPELKVAYNTLSFAFVRLRCCSTALCALRVWAECLVTCYACVCQRRAQKC